MAIHARPGETYHFLKLDQGNSEMKKIMPGAQCLRWLGGLGLCLALLLAGCQSTNIYSNSGGTVDPRLSNSSSAKFFSKSGLQACAGGALVGVLACSASNTSDMGTCMVAAAVAGCGAGMGANYYLDSQRAKYANAEERLNVAIADVRKDNEQLQMLSATARDVISDDRRKLEQIKRDIASNNLRQEQARKDIAGIDANTAYLQKSLADVRNKQEEWRKIAAAERSSGARVDALDGEINRMQQQIVSLESEIDQLYQQRSSIQLG